MRTVLPGYAQCASCEVAWQAPKYGQPRCWRCGRFAKRKYLGMFSPQSLKFDGKGPIDPPYLHLDHPEWRVDDAASRNRGAESQGDGEGHVGQAAIMAAPGHGA